MTQPRLELTCDEADDLAGLYVLDALEGADEAAVRQHLATCPSAHPAFAEVGGVVPALMATIEPIEPPLELRARVLAAVAATPQLAATSAAAATSAVPANQAAPLTPADRPASSAPISLAAERERRAGRFSGAWRTVLAAAAVLLIVVLGATTLTFQRQASDAQARANTLSAALAASLDPGSAVASLRGSGPAASAAGFAAFPQNGSGAGYVVLRGLPAVDAGKTYELWFLAGSTPYPSVLITVGSDGLAIAQGLVATTGADAMALTVEPAGGSQAPTTTPIVFGKLQQGPVAQAGAALRG